MSKGGTKDTLLRTPKNRASRFARIDNAVLQNKDLSFRARGVLAYVLSKPANWQHSAARLTHESNDGLHAIRSALRELQKEGFADLKAARDADGTMRNHWIFRESPSIEKPHTAPSTGLPGAGEPNSGKPDSGKPKPGKTAPLETTVHETTVSETTIKETRVCETAPAPTDSFYVLTEPIRLELARDFNLTGKGVTEADKLFREIKSNYSQDPRTMDAFRGWLRTSTPGKDIARKHRGPGRWDSYQSGSGTPPPVDNGPDGWREFVIENCNPALADGAWMSLDCAQRERIKKLMREPRVTRISAA